MEAIGSDPYPVYRDSNIGNAVDGYYGTALNECYSSFGEGGV